MEMLLAGLVGLLVGVVLTGLVAVVAARRLMVVVHESSKGFDDTVAAIEQAIRENGWASPGTVDMNASMAKHGVEFKPRVKLVKLCKADYAASVLQTDRHLACLMPCTMAVYEGDDGKAYVSKMNTGLMGRLFGGTVAQVMGGHVTEDEARMLENIVRHG